MKKIFTTVLTIFLVFGLYGQNKKAPFDNSYYKLDNIDSLDRYSLDSIRGNLMYYWIYNDSISGLIFPITIYKTYDDWTNDNLFNFIYSENYVLDNIETVGKLENNLNGQYSDLRFIKRDDFNYKKIEYIDSIQRINLKFKDDSLYIDNKLFKKDKTGKIFQRFTGY